MVAAPAKTPYVTPVIELAFSRRDWPRVWLTYGTDRDEGWKDTQVSSLYVAVEMPSGVHYRCYRVRARLLKTAIKRMVRMVRCPWPVRVRVYRYVKPPTEETVYVLQRFNAMLARTREGTQAQ